MVHPRAVLPTGRLTEPPDQAVHPLQDLIDLAVQSTRRILGLRRYREVIEITNVPEKIVSHSAILKVLTAFSAAAFGAPRKPYHHVQERCDGQKS